MTGPPGVLVEDRYVAPEPAVGTGVPVFLGRAREWSGAAPAALTRIADLDRFTSGPTSVLHDAVHGFFLNGGRRCHVVGLRRRGPAGLAEALARAGDLDDVDLVCAPDTAAWPDQEAVHGALLAHCATHGDRFALLDGPPAGFPPVRAAPESGGWGALYAPWLVVRDPSGAVRPAAPSGHVAGLYARCDERAGPHRPPAGEPVEGAVDVVAEPGADGYPDGVNVVAVRPGRGIEVRGARTLSTDPGLRHVGTRRTLISLTRWLRRFLDGLAFEPNDARLRLRITREVTAYLDELHAAGALRGATARDAHVVRCDRALNPPDVVERGTVVARIGVAPQTSAEFLTVRVVHGASGTTVSTEQEGSDDAGQA